MSAKKLLHPALTGQGEQGDTAGEDSELPSELEPDSDSDWLSDTASRTRSSPFLEDDQDSQFNRLGVGFKISGAIRRIKSKLKVGGASGAGRGSAGSGGGEYRLYLWRWFMLGTLTLLNLSNGMVCTWCVHDIMCIDMLHA